MIIICTGKEADKPALKKVTKIIISSYYGDMKSTNKLVVMNQFLPSIKLHHKFINGDINKKKFYKKYIENIIEDREIYASLLTLLLAYQQKKDLCLVCHSDEMKIGYINCLCNLFAEEFGVECITYKKWKEKGKKLGKCKLDKNKLSKLVKKYKNIIFTEEDYKKIKKKKLKKKNEKKKKNKKDNMDGFILIEEETKVKDNYDKNGFLKPDPNYSYKKRRIIHVRKIK